MLFVTLLSPNGRGIDAVKYLRSLGEKEGVNIRHVFFTFGRYDGTKIFEALTKPQP